jgi:lysophospholipase L1-like esterase
MRRRTPAAGVGLALIGLLAGLFVAGGAAPSGAAGRQHRTDPLSIVALGDSFSSGSGIGNVEGFTGCQRSDRDYVALIGPKLRATYRDATCASATTDNADAPQRTGGNGTGSVPPQLAAVRPSTDVVLISLGLNDLQFYYDMIFGCIPMSGLYPTGTPCENMWALTGRPGPIQKLPAIHDRLLRVVQEAQDRAPDATVLVVGYPQLVPATGTCSELPLPTGEYAYFHTAFEALSWTMRDVAVHTGATYVDVLGPSKGHDMCAGVAAWVNGPAMKPGEALPYHPYANEQRAIARLVLQTLKERPQAD